MNRSKKIINLCEEDDIRKASENFLKDLERTIPTIKLSEDSNYFYIKDIKNFIWLVIDKETGVVYQPGDPLKKTETNVLKRDTWREAFKVKSDKDDEKRKYDDDSIGRMNRSQFPSWIK